MWRIWLSLAAFLGLAIPSAEAAHPNRATCGERDSALCSLYREVPGYSGRKLSRSQARWGGTKPKISVEPAANGDPMHATRSTGAKPAAAAMPVKLLAARSFDPLASGTDSAELTAPPAARATEPWLKAILIAVGGGGILSLFLAKAAEL
jgi:hypothetical protein